MRPNKPKCKQLVQYLSDIGVTWPEPPQPESEPAGEGDSEDEEEDAGGVEDEVEEEGKLDEDWGDWEGEESDTLEMDEEVPVPTNPGEMGSGGASSADPPRPTAHGVGVGLESQGSSPPGAASHSGLIITPPPKIPKPPVYTPEAVLATWLAYIFQFNVEWEVNLL